ncbi:MAG TPA: glycogen synthase [Acidimicrobiales bacterium]|nr:glycogen synthase [Acidimicrobiales bacterium]
MRVALATREFPPEVYGGAGVHVEYLARELAALDGVDVAVHAFGEPRPSPLVARTYQPWGELASGTPESGALETMSVDLAIAAHLAGADVVHTHTWYANLAGHLGHLIHGIPHVATSHSLEPLRPWKAEQLGGGYRVSSWCEQVSLEAADAIIAVSKGMRADILRVYPAVAPERVHVIHNGIDPDEYRRVDGTDVLSRFGVDPDGPYAMFVGRITRQKGVIHLLDAARHIDRSAQLVLCAGAPDTPEIAEEMRAAADRARADGVRLVWIEEMLPRADVVELLSHATVFVCPSIYEPFGLINLEAMACETAVVATAVGGIVEVVVDGETGFLVPFEAADDAFGSPRDPMRLARDLADKVNVLLADPSLAARLGAAGRRRVVEQFSWRAIAARTADLYRSLLPGGDVPGSTR